MLSISHLFEKREPYDSHGSFQDFLKMDSKLDGVKANKKLTVQKDLSVNPVPTENRLQLKNQKPLKARITVRMGMIKQEN